MPERGRRAHRAARRDRPARARRLALSHSPPGVARLGFAADGATTRLALLEQRTPLRVLFPRVPAGESLEAVLLNTGGGVVGGDRLEVEVAAGRGTTARVTSQAAEKIYRSAGLASTLDVDLRVAAGAFLEWQPQESILFDRCNFVRHVMLELAPGARALVGEITVFGRTAHGETLRHGTIRDRWSVRRAGRLLWADSLRLEGDLAASLHDPFGLAGARAFGTLIYVADDVREWLAPARALIAAAGVKSGVTCLPGVLIARWLGPDARLLRAAYAGFVLRLRALVAGLPERLPTVWST